MLPGNILNRILAQCLQKQIKRKTTIVIVNVSILKMISICHIFTMFQEPRIATICFRELMVEGDSLSSTLAGLRESYYDYNIPKHTEI